MSRKAVIFLLSSKLLMFLALCSRVRDSSRVLCVEVCCARVDTKCRCVTPSFKKDKTQGCMDDLTVAFISAGAG